MWLAGPYLTLMRENHQSADSGNRRALTGRVTYQIFAAYHPNAPQMTRSAGD